MVNQLKAWVWGWRDCGAMLKAPEQIGDPREPFELIVVEVTDQRQRRPTKVARLVPPGSRVAAVELAAPRLAWFSNDKFVLSGFDGLARERKVVRAAQSSLCQIVVPSK